MSMIYIEIDIFKSFATSLLRNKYHIYDHDASMCSDWIYHQLCAIPLIDRCPLYCTIVDDTLTILYPMEDNSYCSWSITHKDICYLYKEYTLRYQNNIRHITYMLPWDMLIDMLDMSQHRSDVCVTFGLSYLSQQHDHSSLLALDVKVSSLRPTCTQFRTSLPLSHVVEDNVMCYPNVRHNDNLNIPHQYYWLPDYTLIGSFQRIDTVIQALHQSYGWHHLPLCVFDGSIDNAFPSVDTHLSVPQCVGEYTISTPIVIDPNVYNPLIKNILRQSKSDRTIDLIVGVDTTIDNIDIDSVCSSDDIVALFGAPRSIMSSLQDLLIEHASVSTYLVTTDHEDTSVTLFSTAYYPITHTYMRVESQSISEFELSQSELLSQLT